MVKYTYIKENLLSNTVTVMDEDCNLLHINKDVYMLNEGIVSNTYQKIKTGISKLVKKGRGVLTVLGDKVLGYLSPINAAVNAKYPVILTDEDREEADRLGVSYTEFDMSTSLNKDYNIFDSNEGNKSMARLIIQQYINARKQRQETNESIVDNMLFKHTKAIFEAFTTGRYTTFLSPFALTAESGIGNYNRESLKRAILRNLASVLRQGYSEKSMRPPLIWGAPGSGKPDMKKQLIKLISSDPQYKELRTIYLTASNIFPDDFMLPDVIRDPKEVDNYLKGAEGAKATDKAFSRMVSDGPVAVDLPKQWLPVYKQTGNKELDKIKSDYLGKGVWFIDEFSRIPVQTRHVLMTLVQQRELNGYSIGDGWSIICASNRASDMGANQADFVWETAWGGRFQQFNYVPTFHEWLQWAESLNEDTGRPNVWPVITKYLRYIGGEVAWRDTTEKADLLADGRGWAALSKTYYEILDQLKDEDNDIFNYKSDNLNVNIESEEIGINLDELRDFAVAEVGVKAADSLIHNIRIEYVDFNDKHGRNAWIDPDLVNVEVTEKDLAPSIRFIIDRIVNNYPKEGGRDVIDFTPEEYDNVIKTINKIFKESSFKRTAVDALNTAIVSHPSNKEQLRAQKLFISGKTILPSTAAMIVGFKKRVE